MLVETDLDKITNDSILRSEFVLCFHLKFWEPLQCVGGKVYFGSYYEQTYLLKNGKRSTVLLQTLEQVRNKSGICW